MENNYVVTKKAQEDLESIFSYISVELSNKESALELITTFEEKFLSLCDYPEMYPVIINKKLHQNNLRKCNVGNFLIIYCYLKSLHEIRIIRIVYHGYNLNLSE